MPVVPRLDPSPVPTAPLPGVRVPTEAPAAAFGLPNPIDLSQVERNAQELFQREHEKHTQAVVLDADNRLAKLATDLHSSAIESQGLDALNAKDAVLKAWQNGVRDISHGITDDDQMRAFESRVAQRGDSLYNAVELHAAQEHQKFVEQTNEDALTNRVADAARNYQDPKAIQQSIDETKAIVSDFGRQHGWSAETTKAQLDARVTAVHAGVIERMIANRQDLDAAAYLTAHRDEMSGSALTRIEAQVETGSTLGAAQRMRDTIVKSAGTMSAALEQAGRILDPRVRQETEEQVRRYYADQNTSDRLNEQKLALTKKSSDTDTLNKLRNLAGLQPEAFAKLDLSQFMESLSPADFKSLASKQMSMRLSGHAAAQRQAKSDATRLNKQLNAKKNEAQLLQAYHLEVPAALTREIHQLQDSVRQATARVGASSSAAPVPPPVPGLPIGRPAPSAPVPPPVPGLPIGRPAPSAGGVNLSPVPDSTGTTASVPDTWLGHARTDPAYADYLETMGVG